MDTSKIIKLIIKDAPSVSDILVKECKISSENAPKLASKIREVIVTQLEPEIGDLIRDAVMDAAPNSGPDPMDMSALSILRNTLAVDVDFEGRPYVEFALSYGMGSGFARVPVKDFEEFIDFLKGCMNEKFVSKAQLRNTSFGISGVSGEVKAYWKMVSALDSDHMSLRTYLGKGNKPCYFEKKDLSSIIGVLMDISKMIPSAAEKAVKNYNLAHKFGSIQMSRD